MAQEIKRNGNTYVFPDNFTPAQQEEYFKSLEAPSTETNNEIQKQQLKEQGITPIEDAKRGVLQDIPVQIVGGIRDAGQSAINLVEGITENTDSFLSGGVVFGDNASNGVIGFKTKQELIDANIGYAGFGKIGQKDAVTLPEVDKADTVVGSLTRGISQFMAGWYVTKPLGVASKALGAGRVTSSIVQGAGADFVAFDSDTGRFVDTINEHFPSLQNPLFDYLSSEGKDEGFFEARFKNALEGVFLGLGTEGIIRSAPWIKDQIADFASFVKLKRKQLGGEAYDIEKLKTIEERLVNETSISTSTTGKDSTKRLVTKIIDEAGTEKITDTVKTIQEKASAEGLNEKIVNSFTDFIDRARKGESGLDFRAIDENLDFGLSPRAYADTDFGIIVLDAIQKVIKAEKTIDIMSVPLIEKQALKAGGDIVQTTKMLGQLGDKLQGGLKFMYASQAVQQNLADALYKMATSINKNTGEYTLNEMKITTALLMRLMRFDEKVTSNLGRGLNLRRILKDQNVDLGRNQILDLVKSMDNWNGKFEDFAKSVALVKDKNMLIRITDFLFRNQIWNKANELWMASALSLPKTQIINIASNTVNSFLKPLNSWVGSKLTWGLDDITREQVKAQGDEALATMAGYRSYLSDALTFMKKAFNDEDSILFAGSSKFDTNTKALGNSKFAQAVRTPLRALTAMDEFFKQISYRSKLTAIAVREARANKLSTEKIVGTLPDGRQISEFDAYVAERFRNGFDETGLVAMDREASRFAKEVTFTKDLDGILEKVQQITNEVPIMKQILPFVKTPANLAIQAVEMTPLGLFGKNWDNVTGKTRDAVRIAETRGRLAVGTGILGLASMLSLSGSITGGYHPDPEIRKQQQSSGFQPYSIKIGNLQIEYGRLDPIGMLIGTVADFTTIYNDLNEKDRAKVENNLLSFMMNRTAPGARDLTMDDKVANFAVGTYKSIFKNIGSKTYLRGLIDFLKAIDGEDVDKRGAWWLKNKGASYIPNIFTKVMDDPYLREAKTTIDAFMKRAGGFGLAKKYNYLSEPIVDDSNKALRMFNNLVNPFTVKSQKEDFILKKSIEHNISIPSIPNVYKGIDLTQFVDDKGRTALEVFNEEVSKTSLRKSLEQMMKSKSFQDAPDQIVIDANNKYGGKQAMVYEKVKFYRDLAFNNIQYSSKFKSKFNDKISLGQAYINKNVIKDIGSATNKYPKGFKTGIYDFLKNTN